MITSYERWVNETATFMPTPSIIKKCAKSLMAISNERLSDQITDTMRQEYEALHKNKDLFQNQITTLEETLLKMAGLNWKTPDGFKQIADINKIHTEFLEQNPGKNIEEAGTKVAKIIQSLRAAKNPLSSLENE